MKRAWFTIAVAALTVLLACSQKDRVQDADVMALSQEGRGNPLLSEGTPADGVELESVFFDYNRATLRPAGRKALQDHAAWMKKHPKTMVQIEGSCDDRGSEDYNIALGQKRAQAAKAYLVQLGVAAERIAVVSHGKLPGSSANVRAKNRRGAFVVFYSE